VKKHKPRKRVTDREHEQVRHLLALKTPPKEIRAETGISLSKIYEINQSVKRQNLDPLQRDAYIEKLKEHWVGLLAILGELQGVVAVYAPDPRELRQWIVRATTEPERQGPGGMLRREPGGTISFKLFAEDREEWPYLNEHLAGDSLLTKKLDWVQSICRDLESRWALFEALLRYVEANTGLTVRVSPNDGDIKADGLHNYYIDMIYNQVFRNACGLSPVPMEQNRLTCNLEDRGLYFEDHLVAIGCDKQGEGEALRLLFNRQTDFAVIAEAKPAGEAYRQVDEQSQVLKGALARFLQLSGSTPDTRCAVCKPWFEALGVTNEGPGC